MRNSQYIFAGKKTTGKMLLDLPVDEIEKGTEKAVPPAAKGSGTRAPRNERERKLQKIWQTLLNVENIGIDDDFVKAGGDSLKAVTVLSRVSRELAVELQLGDIFKNRTIRGLAELIEKTGKSVYTSIEPGEKKEYYPLSAGQKRLYILQQMQEAGTAYNMYRFFVIEEPDPGRLDRAFNQLIARHESLRTSFLMIGGEPVQRIHEENYKLQITNYKAQVPDVMKRFICPFHLSKVPLLRVGLVKMAGEKYLLMVDMHHIVSDGVSHLVLIRDFARLVEGGELPRPRLRYVDYAQWQNERKGEEAIKKQAAFWLEELAGELPVVNLPADYPRPTVYNFEGSAVDFEITNEETRALKEIAAGRGATLYMVLLAIYNILLAKVCNQEVIVAGTPTAGRKQEDLGQVIGMFVNTLVLKNYPAGGKTFQEFLEQLKDRTLKAFENQDYQFEDLVETLAVKRDTGRNPLFDVSFTFQDMAVDDAGAPVPRGDAARMKVTPYEFESNTAKFDLMLTGFEVEGKLSFSFQYSSQLFKKTTIQRFSDYFSRIVPEIIAAPHQKIAQIEIITAAEKNRLLFEFNDTWARYPEDKTIHRLFAEQAEKTPGAIAVVGGAQVTYNELNTKANRLAEDLIKKGVLADSIVAIMAAPSIEMIVGLLAILKAGGAYLPIDPDYPGERIDFMLKDSSASILLTSTGLSARSLNSSAGRPFPPATCNLHLSLSYVIYTSGTTGKPKGALIQHKNVVRLLFNDRFQFDFGDWDIWTMFHSFNFDFSVWEMYGALLYGGRLLMVSRAAARDPGRFLEILIKGKATVLNQTPSAFYNLAEEVLNRPSTPHLQLRYIIFGGEALKPLKLKQWKAVYPGIKLVNMFGITETTVHVTYKEITDREIAANISNIGKPIPTLTVYVLDRNRCLVPIGTPGELYVAGAGLARGYLNRPELTAKRVRRTRPICGGSVIAGSDHLFPLKQFGQKLLTAKTREGARRFNMSSMSYLSYTAPSPLYKSGDLVRLLESGDMEYLGRIDHQVQVRGFRVELGEIENRLLMHKEIKEAVATAREDGKKGTVVCAYIVLLSASSPRPSVSRLREYLSGHLPGYMIPAYFVYLDEIPLTANGKVDRRRLPEPGVDGTGPYRAPGTGVEKIIADTWKEVLGVDRVGVEDNFFDLGGNSLLVVKLNNRLREVFKRKIPVVEMFRTVTVSSFARYLEQGEDREEGEPGEDRRRMAGTGVEIAVIGMAGRFPGAANIEEFWHNLEKGLESISFFSDEELEEGGAAPELLADPDYVKARGYLEGREYFDASFFGYIPGEARVMDPQVRLFHESAWQALEDAGYDAHSYNGLIGLYAGASPNFYWEAAAALAGVGGGVDAFSASQLKNKDNLCTRVAFKLDLKGPAVTVQTACSTSLVAIETACRALLAGSCDMALAGGVSASYARKTGYTYQEGMISSVDGHCRTFDARARGTVGGEGVGVVVLKPLADALRDRDHIYAAVKGFAVNNDGMAKAGYTAPGIDGQAAVIRSACRAAGVELESIGYIETHGTATPLGDPIEIEALSKVFVGSRGGFFKKSPLPPEAHSCAIGSVKTNMGHLDAAAGAAGFIKTVLALKYRCIPPSLHFENLNPAIDFENTPFYVASKLIHWKNDRYPLRAGVSSFGIGGTNAHVVLEEWRKGDDLNHEGHEGHEGGEYRLLLWSAKTSSALDKMTANLAAYVKNNNLADAAYTLQTGRRAFQHRGALVCADVNEAAAALSSPDQRKVKTNLVKEENGPVVFMFPGLGSQYVNMGLELYRKELFFREEMDRCFEILKPLMSDNIKEILFPTHPAPTGHPSREGTLNPVTRIDQTGIGQVVIFIFECALAKLLMKWGIKPRVMIGYSLGEYAAACIAGVFSLEDALKLIVTRSKLIQSLPGGVMLSVPLDRGQLEPLLNGGISLAIDNGPSCIAAGPHEAMDAFERQMKEKKLLCMRLNTSHAIHSRMMGPILAEFKREAGGVVLNKPRIPFISNVTGQRITDEEAVDPGYWANHLRKTVRFGDGTAELKKEPAAVFIEVGPGRDLSALVTRDSGANPGQRAVNLVGPPGKDMPDMYYLLHGIGRLWLLGQNVDWTAFHANEKRYRVPLPLYPFEGRRYWIDGDPFDAGAGMLAKGAGAFGKRDISDWFYVPTWKRTVSPLTLSSGDSPGSNSCRLIFADDNGPVIKTAVKLRQQGFEIITVSEGETFALLDNETYTINIHRKEDYETLLSDLIAKGRTPGKIVHALSTTPRDKTKVLRGCRGQFFKSAPCPPEAYIKTFNQHQEAGFYSLLFLVQALAKGPAGPIDIIVVTDNVQAVTGEEGLCPGKATIMGLCKTIPLEYPNISCRGIDLELPRQDGEAELIRRLTAELLYQTNDAVVAYRGTARWVQQFEPLRLERVKGRPKKLKEKGVYLITGGLGRDGLARAAYLAGNLKARLVLTGRRGLPGREDWDQWITAHDEDDETSAKIKKVRELEALGSEVLVMRADVAGEADMRAVMKQIDETFGQLDGVIHAAGITTIDSSVIISQLGSEECRLHFVPKVYGLYVLREVLADRDVDFCLLTSSIASVLGGGGLSAYTAASMFMDAFAHQQNQTNPNSPVWTSLNWEGASPRETGEAFHRTASLGPISQIVVSQLDLDQRLEERNKPEFSPPQKRPDLLSDYVPPRNPTEQKLVHLWQNFFGFEQIGIKDDFVELGGDSLKAIGMISRIHKEFNVKVSLADFFKGNTIKQLTQTIEGAAKEKYTTVEPVEKKEYYPLSSAQKRLFILSEAGGITTTYNMAGSMVFAGTPRNRDFEEIFRALIQRHESLRTSFHMTAGEPVQRIHDEVEFAIEYYDLATDKHGRTRTFSATEDTEKREKRRKEETHHSSFRVHHFIRPFDLSRAPLLRAALVQQEKEKYMLMYDMHHIISDGISMDILTREFAALYKKEKQARLKIQYKDFSEWQNQLFRSNLFKEQEKYWLEEVFNEKGDIPVLWMPLDFRRPRKRTFAGRTMFHPIANTAAAEINTFARERNVTLNILMFAVYTLLISKYSGQEEIIVGSLAAGRRHADLEKIMGIFINFLPIPNKINARQTFEEFLNSTKTTVLKAYENQDYPFERIVENLDGSADASRNPLFDTMLVFRNEMELDIHQEFEDSELQGNEYESPTAALDFKMDVHTTPAGEAALSLQYNINLFKEETMKKFFNRFNTLLEKVIRNPQIKPAEIRLFDKDEELQLREKRTLNTLSKPIPLQLAVSASFTSEPLKDHIRWWGKQFGLDINIQFAPYNQVFQQLLDESGLISTNPGFNLLLVRFEDWIREDQNPGPGTGAIEQDFAQLVQILEHKEKAVPYLVGVFPVSTHLDLSAGMVKELEKIDERWSKLLMEMDNVHVIDFRGLKETYKIREIFDPLADREAHIPFSDEFFAASGTDIAGKIVELEVERSALLVNLDAHPLASREFTAAELLQLAQQEAEQEQEQDPETKLAPYEAPANETQGKLQQMWEARLRKENIGINHDYFALGGDSLKAAALVSSIHKEFNTELRLKDIFDNPTIKKLARVIIHSEESVYSSIKPVDRKEYYPLSPAQKRLFILSEIEGIDTTYNMPGAMTIEGQPCKERFDAVFQALIRRHESFRTSFHMIGGEPVQEIHDEVEFEIECFNLTAKTREDTRIEKEINFTRPFDLSRAPLLRAALVQKEEEKYTFLFDLHHIISDGISMAVLVREFTLLYEEKKPAPLRIQYKDFSAWQNKLFQSGNFKKQETYWLEEQFSGELPLLNMPLDFKRPAKRTFAGHTLSYTIEPAVVEKLHTLARRQKITLNILLFAAYSLLLSKYSGQRDIVVGSLVAGRRHADLENIMGMFANFLPIRVRIDPQHNLVEFLTDIQKTMLDAYENQDYPFDRMVENLPLSNFTPAARNPLFDTMLIFQDQGQSIADYEIKGLTFKPEPLEDTAATLDLKLDVFSPPAPADGTGGMLYLVLQYNTRLFKQETMEKLLDHFNRVLEKAVENPVVKLADIELFGPAEALELAKKRALEPATSIKSLQMVVGATFTSEPIRDHIRWWGKQCGLAIDVNFAPYNQVFQQLLDENGLLSVNKGVNVLLVRFEDWIREEPLTMTDEEKYDRIERNFHQLNHILAAKEKTVPYIINLFPVSTHLALSANMMQLLEGLYGRWRKLLEEMDNVYIVTFEELQEHYPLQEIFNPLTDREGHLPFSEAYYAALAVMIVKTAHGITVNNRDTRRNIFAGKKYSGEELAGLPVHEAGMGLFERKPYAPPRDETEQQLHDIWASLLGIQRIGIDDDYFQLGGNSLNAVTLVSRVHQVFLADLRLNHIFANTTIRKFAHLIKNTKKTDYSPIEQTEEKEYYPLSPAQASLGLNKAARRANKSFSGGPGGRLFKKSRPTGGSYSHPPDSLSMETSSEEFSGGLGNKKSCFLGPPLPAGGTNTTVLEIKGKLDQAKLEEAFRLLIARHESYRTSFHVIDDEPVQEVHGAVDFEIEYYNLATDEHGQTRTFLADKNAKGREGAHHSSFITHHFGRPFDLSRAPLLRVGLVRTGEHKHLLIVDNHQIIDDGTSVRIFTRDLSALYSGVELPVLKTRYRDYSQWRNCEAVGERMQKQKQYWLDRFSGEIPLLELPADFPRPGTEDIEGGTIDFDIGKEITGALKQHALAENVTLYMVLLAAYNILLAGLSGQRDIIVATPVACRNHVELQDIIGRFANTVAIRNDLKGGKTYREFLGQLRESTLKAFENQEYRFRDLVDALGTRDRHSTHRPLADVYFALQNIVVQAGASAAAEPADVQVSPYELEDDGKRSEYDLVLTGGEVKEAGGLHFTFRYRTGLFKRETVEKFITHFKQILSIILKTPDVKLSEI